VGDYGQFRPLISAREPPASVVLTAWLSMIAAHQRHRAEPMDANGLVEWLLGAAGPVRGFTLAIFSGLPTDELVRVIVDHVLPHPETCGIWRVSAAPINKHDLLVLLRGAYGRTTAIVPGSRRTGCWMRCNACGMGCRAAASPAACPTTRTHRLRQRSCGSCYRTSTKSIGSCGQSRPVAWIPGKTVRRCREGIHEGCGPARAADQAAL